MDTLAPSYINSTVNTPGSAAGEAEKKKISKYSGLLNRFIFVPIGFETFGPWGTEAKAFIASLGKKLREKTGESRSAEFLKQRFSIEIQRGNAASVLGIIPPTKAFDEVFFVP